MGVLDRNTGGSLPELVAMFANGQQIDSIESYRSSGHLHATIYYSSGKYVAVEQFFENGTRRCVVEGRGTWTGKQRQH